MIPVSCLLLLLWYMFSFLIHFLFFLFFFFFFFFFCIASHNDVHMEYSGQAGPTAGVTLDPPHLSWSVYAYGPDGFARECAIGRNTNVMGYSFPKGT